MDDDQLKQRLVICQGCGTRGPESLPNKPVVSVPRGWDSD